VPYLKVLWTIVRWFLGFLTVLGLLGGLAADIPELNEEPTIGTLLQFASRLLRFLLHVLVKYPDGVIVFGGVAVIVIGFLQDKTIGRQQKEFEERRRKKLGKGKRK
jgi:hypothetical protein